MALARVFDALPSRPRRQILAYLSDQAHIAGEIGARFQITAPAISCHLSVLERAGLVRSNKRRQDVDDRSVPATLINTLSGFALGICPPAGPLRREPHARRRDAPVTATAAATLSSLPSGPR